MKYTLSKSLPLQKTRPPICKRPGLRFRIVFWFLHHLEIFQKLYETRWTIKGLMLLWWFRLWLSVRKELRDRLPFSSIGPLSNSREFIQHLFNNYFNTLTPLELRNLKHDQSSGEWRHSMGSLRVRETQCVITIQPCSEKVMRSTEW